MPLDSAMNPVKKSQSLDEQAYQLIKQAIIQCALPPGESVAELRLASEMGISKTPIRKAMARLHQEGFLDNVPYRGYSVAEISVQDVAEVYQLRQILECYLVTETALHFSLAELDEIEQLIDKSDAALASGAPADYVEFNREFHRTFARKSGSQRIADILRNLEEHVRRIILYVVQSGDDDLLDNQRDDHRQILMALREGDVAQATSMMRIHLSSFATTLVSRLQTRQSLAGTDQATTAAE